MSKIIESMPTYSSELSHEKEMVELGKQRTNKRRLSHIQRGEESVTNYGKILVSETIRPLAYGIVNFLEQCAKQTTGQPPVAFMFLSGIDPEVTALITAKHIINTITNHRPLTATCIALGGKIETEEQLKNFKNLNPELYETVKMDLDKRSWNYAYKRRKLRESAKRGEVAWEEWTTPQKLHVGIRLVDLMVATTGMIEVGTETINRKKTKILKQTQKTKDWIADRNSFNELLNPEYLPLVMFPKQWEAPVGGGYWTSEMPELDLVKVRNNNFKKELENFDLSKIYSAVNAMQNTPFKINQYILKVMQEAWDNEIPIGGVPPANDLPVPNKPHDIETNEEARKEWKKQAVITHTENARMFSKRLLYAKILWTAHKFEKYKTLYFPLQLDFRGRAYCVPAFLNYQAVSGAKALLNFSNGKAITKENKGEFWLAVHGANMWGEDKISLKDRVQWVQDNEAMIIKCAQEPLVNKEWESTSSAFQTLAWCEEWRQYKEHGEGFVSTLPISIDGTCNGLQLYSLMLKDEEAGKLVNVVPSTTPQDIYQIVADAVILKLHEHVAEGGYPYAQLWLNYGVKRSTTKRSIMTICYGSTRYSCTDFVVEELTKRKDKGEQHPFGNDIFKPSTYLAGVIWESIGNNLNSAREGMDYLQACARILAKEQLPIHWLSPIGFPVYQSYPEMKSKRVKAMLAGEIIKPRINTETDKTDKLRMSNGIAPNLVHSLDSACMMQTVNIAYSKGLKSFANVHDSFGTTAGDMECLTECLKEAFTEIFTQHNVLQEFKDDIYYQVPEHLRDDLPDVPDFGQLDVNELKNCEFFFS